jgi:DNA-binding CsgD family transcriptional regulator
MPLWERFRRLWKRSQPEIKRTYNLDDPFHIELNNIAIQENRTQEEITANVLAAGMYQYRKKDELLQLWYSLSLRERDVTAHACLGLTNRQIAARMGISPETVKSYLETVLHKLGLRSKAELRVLFANFGFEAWEKPHP